MNRVIPSINGYASVMENIGKTESTGVDLTLSTVNIQTRTSPGSQISHCHTIGKNKRTCFGTIKG